MALVGSPILSVVLPSLSLFLSLLKINPVFVFAYKLCLF